MSVAKLPNFFQFFLGNQISPHLMTPFETHKIRRDTDRIMIKRPFPLSLSFSHSCSIVQSSIFWASIRVRSIFHNWCRYPYSPFYDLSFSHPTIFSSLPSNMSKECSSLLSSAGRILYSKNNYLFVAILSKGKINLRLMMVTWNFCADIKLVILVITRRPTYR